jgi:hypothetical protein
VLRKSSRRRRRRRRKTYWGFLSLAHEHQWRGVMGCRALRTVGKLRISSSWAGAGRNRKSGDWSPSSAYTDHGPGVSVHTGRAVSCYFHWVCSAVRFSSHIQTLSNNEQNQVNGTYLWEVELDCTATWFNWLLVLAPI